MKLFGKKENIIEKVETKEVDAAEVYLVSWNARYGHYMSDTKRVAKAFLSDTDAITFMKSLEEAAKLLQYTERIDVKLEKQQ